MDKLSHLIPKVLQKRGLKDQANASYAIHLANTWMQQNLPALSENMHATSLSGGIVYISVNDATSEQELTKVSAELKQYLNRIEDISVLEIRILR